MFTYLDKKIVVLDIEFTDRRLEPLSLRAPEIAEIAGVLCTSDMEIISEFSSLVQPSDLDSWSEGCERLTGITQEDLKNADSWEKVGKQWAEWANYNYVRLASWHFYSDVAVLQAAYKRAKLAYPHIAFGVDIASLAYGLFSYWGITPTSWGLQSIAQILDLQLNEKEQHRALYDAKIAHGILKCLMDFESTFSGENYGIGDTTGSKGHDL